MATKNKEVTYDQFVAYLNAGNRGYMKKPRSWQKVWFWWEDKDQWFLNKAYEERKSNTIDENGFMKSSWITAKDLPSHLPFMERKGYKYYIE